MEILTSYFLFLFTPFYSTVLQNQYSNICYSMSFGSTGIHIWPLKWTHMITQDLNIKHIIHIFYWLMHNHINHTIQETIAVGYSRKKLPSPSRGVQIWLLDQIWKSKLLKRKWFGNFDFLTINLDSVQWLLTNVGHYFKNLAQKFGFLI